MGSECVTGAIMSEMSGEATFVAGLARAAVTREVAKRAVIGLLKDILYIVITKKLVLLQYVRR